MNMRIRGKTTLNLRPIGPDPNRLGPVPGGRTQPSMSIGSLHDVFQWPYYNMCRLQQILADPLSTLRSGLANFTSTSSCFSGIAAEGVAMNAICAAVNHEMPDQPSAPHPFYSWSIELDDDADRELHVLPHGPACRFKNVLDFASDKLKARLALMSPPYKWDELWSLVQTEGWVTRTARCRAHGRCCTATHTFFHASGCPCVDFSTWGKGRKLSGPSTPALAVWFRLMLLIQPCIVLIENVVQFPVALARDIFGVHYDIDFIDLTAHDTFGHCVRRKRRLVLCTLKTAVRLERPLSLLPELFSRCRKSSFTWRSLLVAKPAEQRIDLLWAKQRKDTGAANPSGPSGARPVATPQSNAAGPSRDEYMAALIPSEHVRREIFLRDHKCSDCVISLGQDPTYTRAASTDTTLHAVVKNNHILWSEEHGRFLTARETLIGQGFPCTNECLQAMQPHATQPMALCSFNRSRVAKSLPPRHRVEMTSQSGNSIFVPMIGAILHFLLAFVEPITPEERDATQAYIDSVSLVSRDDELLLWRRKRSRVLGHMSLALTDSALSSLVSVDPTQHLSAQRRQCLRSCSSFTVSSDISDGRFSDYVASSPAVSVSDSSVDDFASALKRARQRKTSQSPVL